jgi:hypothetical protein
VRCVSAGAERREGVLCVAPAYVVSPQAKKKKHPSQATMLCVSQALLDFYGSFVAIITGIQRKVRKAPIHRTPFECC